MLETQTIRRLQSFEADSIAAELTRIALAAKRHWDYPEAWIQEWIPLLTFTPESIRQHPVWGAFEGSRLLGFTVLEQVDTTGSALASVVVLEHMWIDPACHGRGLGRLLFNALHQQALKSGADHLEVTSDPFAEGFYRRMGFLPHGTFESTVAGRLRRLPVLRMELKTKLEN